MALQMHLTFSDTGVDVPQAYGVITDATVLMAQGVTNAVINWWWNQADATAQTPLKAIRTENITLPSNVLTTANPAFVSALQAQITGGQILTPMDALKAALYILVMQQPSYASAQSV